MTTSTLNPNQIAPAAVPNGTKNPLDWSLINSQVGSSQQGVGSDITTNSSIASGYSVYSWPSDLNVPLPGTTDSRYPYYMVFYVNANSKSAIIKDKAVHTTTGAGSNSVNNSASDFIRNWDSTTTIGATLAKFKAITKRLTVAVALPMPQTLVYSHGAGYDLAQSGFMGTMLNDASNDSPWWSAGYDALKRVAQDAPNWVGNVLADKLNKHVPGSGNDVKPGENFDSIKMKIMGIAQNERKEQVFKGMDPRRFSFSWLMVPKNKAEADMITSIIKWMKYNQYPEVDMTGKSGGLNVIIPNEFDIEFYFNDSPMTSIAKISTCVLEKVEVNTTPLGKWIAYDGTDAPVATHVTFNFVELEPLTRLQIANGY